MRSLALAGLVVVCSLPVAAEAGSGGWGGWGNGERGNGSLKAESRDLKGFTKVELSLPIDATIKQGDFAVSVKTDSNLLSRVITRVEGETLVVETKDSIDPNDRSRIEVSLPELRGLSVDGSSDVQVQNMTRRSSFALAINGSGDVTYDGSPSSLAVDVNGSGDVKASLGDSLDAVEVEINGSGDVSLRGGTANTLAVEVHGSGNVNARSLQAHDGTFSVQGSGDIQATLNGGQARFETGGSGDIRWWGDAQVRARISDGSGEVVHER